MRGKTAKAIRSMAKEFASAPGTSYTTAPTSSKTIMVHPDCLRGVYLAMKNDYKGKTGILHGKHTGQE